MHKRWVVVASLALAFGAGCKESKPGEADKAAPAGDKAAPAGDKAAPAGDKAAPDKAAPDKAAPAPDKAAPAGMPRGRDGAPVSAPAGGTLKDSWDDAEGRGWIYVYDEGDPLQTAEQVRAALVGAGARPVVQRAEPIGRFPSPPTSVFSAFGDRMVGATTYRDKLGRVWLSIFDAPLTQLMTPPAGYPADFPFLPFAIPHDRAPAGKIGLVYNATTEAIDAELMDAASAAGWACDGVEFTVCRAAGKPEVGLSIAPLSTGRASLIITAM